MLLYQIMMILFSDLKKLYFQAGVENKPTVFLFNDIQVQWNNNQILSTYLSFFWYVTEPITIVCCFPKINLMMYNPLYAEFYILYLYLYSSFYLMQVNKIIL